MDGPDELGDGEATSSPTEGASPQADAAEAHRLARLLIALAVQIAAAERRDAVIRATRVALSAGLPAGVEIAFSGLGADRVDHGVRIYTAHGSLEDDFPDLARYLAPGGDATWLVVPLVLDEHDLGAVGVTWPREAPSDATREFLATAARLVSLALRSVEERTRTHEVTERLQRSLLPIVAPINGLDVEYRYQPAGRDALAGGDFYDVIELGPDLTAIVIGDVAGHGIDAAAASGEVRYLARGVLEHTRDPSEVLCLVESALVRGGRPPTMVTVLCAQIDGSNDLLRMASAGHYPPIIRTASGAVHRAVVPIAPPLGAGFVQAANPPVVATVPFGPGDVAVLYTDGLVERRGTPLDVVLEAVEAVVGRHADPASLCRHLADFAALDRDHDDDLALLVVRRHDERLDAARIERVPPEVGRV